MAYALLSLPSIKNDWRIIMKDEKNWYRCTTREEMVKLVVAGFNYTNFRKDRFNDGNFTYYFERTKELDDYLASTARV